MMTRSLLATSLALVVLVSSAEARERRNVFPESAVKVFPLGPPMAGDSLPRRGGQDTSGRILFYLGDRVGDFFDIFDLNVSLGPGFGAGLSYGLGYIGAEIHGAGVVGLDGRYLGSWREERILWGFPFSLPMARERPPRRGRSGRLPSGWEAALLGIEEDIQHEPVHPAVGLQVHLFFLGARARVRPFQIVDFFTSLFGYDLDRSLGPNWRERRKPIPRGARHFTRR